MSNTKFRKYGKHGSKVILCMHGMCQNWRSEYEALKSLEEHFHLIFPAMDGMHPDSSEFTSFANLARHIEEYMRAYHGGHLDGLGHGE